MVNFKRFCAALSAIALTTGTFAVFQTTSVQQLSADTVYAAGESVANVNGGSAIYGLYRAADANGYYMYYDMESDTAAFSARGGCTLGAGDAYKGNRGLGVSGRQEEWNGIMIPLDSAVFSAGNEYSFSAAYRGAADATFKMTLQYSLAGTESYDEIISSAASAGTYTVLSNPNYRIPAGASDLTLVFETTDSPCDFSIDEVIVAEAGTKPGASVSDTSGTPGDLDGDGKINVADFVLFKSGMVSNWTAEGIKNSANADVDRSTEVNAEDALNFQKYLLGVITEFPDNAPAVPQQPEPTVEPTKEPDPVPEPVKSAYSYNPAISFKEAPGNYFNPCQQAGKITKENYNGINGNNTCNVYTPYGYDPSKKYNILYLMHGGGENENTIFYNDDAKMANMFDHMIMNGELEPLIVVTPTFNKCEAQTFYKEWLQSLIPFVEGKYSTYAASTSQADLKASRYHRAYGGFSMGSVSTWAGMVHGGLDVCAYWLPLSGDHWEGQGGYGKAKSVADAIHAAGLKQNEYFIMCATGSDDIAYPNVTPQIDEMKKMSEFVYTSDLSKGNFYYLVAQGKTHWWGYVRHYVYDILPSFFHEGN